MRRLAIAPTLTCKTKSRIETKTIASGIQIKTLPKFQPGVASTLGNCNRNRINSQGVRERFQRCMGNLLKTPGLEAQPWAGIRERLWRSEFLCKAALRKIQNGKTYALFLTVKDNSAFDGARQTTRSAKRIFLTLVLIGDKSRSNPPETRHCPQVVPTLELLPSM